MNVTINRYTPSGAGSRQRAEFIATIDVARNVRIEVLGEHRGSRVHAGLINLSNVPRGMDSLRLVDALIEALVLQAIEQSDHSRQSSIAG